MSSESECDASNNQITPAALKFFHLGKGIDQLRPRLRRLHLAGSTDYQLVKTEGFDCWKS
jgi:hypothetical protein